MNELHFKIYSNINIIILYYIIFIILWDPNVCIKQKATHNKFVSNMMRIKSQPFSWKSFYFIESTVWLCDNLSLDARV